MEKFNEIVAKIAKAKSDALSFYEKGNKAAGTRLRAVMQDLKVLAQQVRTEVTEKKNS